MQLLFHCESGLGMGMCGSGASWRWLRRKVPSLCQCSSLCDMQHLPQSALMRAWKVQVPPVGIRASLYFWGQDV